MVLWSKNGHMFEIATRNKFNMGQAEAILNLFLVAISNIWPSLDHSLPSVWQLPYWILGA